MFKFQFLYLFLENILLFCLRQNQLIFLFVLRSTRVQSTASWPGFIHAVMRCIDCTDHQCTTVHSTTLCSVAQCWHTSPHFTRLGCTSLHNSAPLQKTMNLKGAHQIMFSSKVPLVHWQRLCWENPFTI